MIRSLLSFIPGFKPCGCIGTKLTKNQSAPLVRIRYLEGDPLKREERFMGSAPAWIKTKLIRVKKIEEEVQRENYSQKIFENTFYYRCKVCDRIFSVETESKGSRNYDFSAIDREAVVAESDERIPSVGPEEDDFIDSVEEPETPERDYSIDLEEDETEQSSDLSDFESPLSDSGSGERVKDAVSKHSSGRSDDSD